MRLCFLILTAPYLLWKQLTHGVKTTWIQDLNSRHDAAFEYLGMPAPFNSGNCFNSVLRNKRSRFLWKKNQSIDFDTKLIDEDKIFVQVVDRWDTMFTKFLCTANYVNSILDYDYLIKVNTTTWTNVEILRTYLEDRKPKCAGVVSKSKDFPAGWASIFSRSTMDDIISESKNQMLIARGYDDELVGKLLQKMRVKLEKVEYANFPSTDRQNLHAVPFIRIKSQQNRQIEDLKKFDDLNTILRNR